MDGRKCLRCGTAHFSTQPCPAEKAKSDRIALADKVLAEKVEQKKPRGRPKTGFKKDAYNREYMRKKRAKEKPDAS